MDNKIRDKFLTEAVGECWHEVHRPLDVRRGICKKCGERLYFDTNDRPQFSTWNGFGKLWEWSQKQEWFPELIRQTCYYEMCRNEFSKGHDSIIHPDRFADAVYCYLAE